jgi:hypothetical protein
LPDFSLRPLEALEVTRAGPDQGTVMGGREQSHLQHGRTDLGLGEMREGGEKTENPRKQQKQETVVQGLFLHGSVSRKRSGSPCLVSQHSSDYQPTTSQHPWELGGVSTHCSRVALTEKLSDSKWAGPPGDEDKHATFRHPNSALLHC